MSVGISALFSFRGREGDLRASFVIFLSFRGKEKKRKKILRKLTEIRVLWHRKSLSNSSPVCLLQCWLKIIFHLGELVLHRLILKYSSIMLHFCAGFEYLPTSENPCGSSSYHSISLYFRPSATQRGKNHI